MLIMHLSPTSLEGTLLVSVLVLFVLSEHVGGGIIPWLRRGGGNIKRKDSGSKLLITGSLFVSIIIAIWFAENNIAILPDWLFYPGIFLMVMGILVRQWAIFILGRFFTTTVSVQKNQKVVDYGPYRYVRHPAYSGLLMVIIGLGVALQSWGGILVMLVILGLAIGYRIQVEEKVLITQLGDDYIRYMKRTKSLIPFVL
jgi:protein-S-isoprenylcysteine O-methyltransferase Ste14